ncbi:MAG: hypothetical protein LV481_17720 [Methylacidiphilales bacterium]|nr:hypothetical protein [Candidatus Methylacidiphilales bacterium]
MRILFFSAHARQGGLYNSRNVRAFSLVEVVLALGVTAFAILAMVSLLPVGLESSKESLDESGAINVMSAVIADRKATPLTDQSSNYFLPALSNTMTVAMTNTFGVSDSSPYTTNNLSGSHYLVECVFMPPANGSSGLAPYQAYIKVSWPALNSNSSDFVDTVATIPQP